MSENTDKKKAGIRWGTALVVGAVGTAVVVGYRRRNKARKAAQAKDRKMRRLERKLAEAEAAKAKEAKAA